MALRRALVAWRSRLDQSPRRVRTGHDWIWLRRRASVAKEYGALSRKGSSSKKRQQGPFPCDRLRTAAKSRVLGPVNLPRTSLGRRRQLKAGIGQSNLIFEIGPYRRKRVRPQTGDKG